MSASTSSASRYSAGGLGLDSDSRRLGYCPLGLRYLWTAVVSVVMLRVPVAYPASMSVVTSSSPFDQLVRNGAWPRYQVTPVLGANPNYRVLLA